MGGDGYGPLSRVVTTASIACGYGSWTCGTCSVMVGIVGDDERETDSQTLLDCLLAYKQTRMRTRQDNCEKGEI